MINGSLNKIQTKNAAMARDLEYIKESMSDDNIDSIITRVTGDTESFEELAEAAEYIDKMNIEGADVMESAEVDRILTADHDLTFEEMIGA